MVIIQDSFQQQSLLWVLWSSSSHSSDAVALFASHVSYQKKLCPHNFNWSLPQNAFWISTRSASWSLSFCKSFSPSSCSSTTTTSRRPHTEDGIGCGPAVRSLSWTKKQSIKSNEPSSAAAATHSSIMAPSLRRRVAHRTHRLAISCSHIRLLARYRSRRPFKTTHRGSLTCPSPWPLLR